MIRDAWLVARSARGAHEHWCPESLGCLELLSLAGSLGSRAAFGSEKSTRAVCNGLCCQVGLMGFTDQFSFEA